MTRKLYPYSLDRKDAKIAGVCSTVGGVTGIDPTFIRIGFVAAAIFTSFTWTVVIYAALGIYFSVQKKKSMTTDRKKSDFDRMGEVAAEKAHGPRDGQRPRPDRPPADGDRSSYPHPK